MTTIAFDLDGTLVDSLPHIHAVTLHTLSDMNLPSDLSLDEVRGFVGHGLPPFIAKLAARLGVPADRAPDLQARFTHHYTTLPTDPDSVFPGVRAALTTLRDQGYRLTLCTNKIGAATQSVLRDTGLAAFFDIVVAGDSLPTRKPDPAMLLAATKGADHALFVGDSEVDAQTAQRAQMRFVLFTGGYSHGPWQDMPHHAAFGDFRDLPALVAAVDQPAR